MKVISKGNQAPLLSAGDDHPLPEDVEAPELGLAHQLFGRAEQAPTDTRPGIPRRNRPRPSHPSSRVGKVPFHIQHNTTLSVVEALLGLVPMNASVSCAELARKAGFGLATIQGHCRPFLHQCGLTTPGRVLRLSLWGRVLRSLWADQPQWLGEVLHARLYTLHWFQPETRFSWAYAQVADALWQQREQGLAGETMDYLVSRVVMQAEEELAVSAADIAFSHHSIRGVLNWLRELQPPAVFKGPGRYRVFRRRSECPAQSLVWALDAMQRRERTQFGETFALSPERQEQLCRLCVLEPAALDAVLAETQSTSDAEWEGLFEHGREADGTRWIRMARPCPLPTLAGGTAP